MQPVHSQPDFEHVLQHTKATKIAEDIGRFHSELLKQEADAGVADDALIKHRIAEKGLFPQTGCACPQCSAVHWACVAVG